jgi:hypothetical protein
MKRVYIQPLTKMVRVRLEGSVLYEPGMPGGTEEATIGLGKRNDTFEEEDESQSSWNVWNSYDQ